MDIASQDQNLFEAVFPSLINLMADLANTIAEFFTIVSAMGPILLQLHWAKRIRVRSSDSYTGTRVLGYPGYPALFLISGNSGNAVGYPGTRIGICIY